MSERGRARRVRTSIGSLLLPALLVLLLVVWAVLLRPVALGGPAGYVLVAGNSMQPTLSAGSLVVTMPLAEYQIGDVVAFRVVLPGPAPTPLVIHRIVGGSPNEGYVTQGDNLPHPDPWIVDVQDIIGREVWSLGGVGPLLGFLRSPVVVASVAAAAAAYVVLSRPGSSGAAGGAPRPRALISRLAGRDHYRRRRPGSPAAHR